jgi:hypothetical protein
MATFGAIPVAHPTASSALPQIGKGNTVFAKGQLRTERNEQG